MEPMYSIGLDVHKRKISYCVKGGSGTVYAQRSIPAPDGADEDQDQFAADGSGRELQQAAAASGNSRESHSVHSTCSPKDSTLR
jgi:hypothetical protein